jgi:HAD superfamily hydrolase (TIGR01509 family)
MSRPRFDLVIFDSDGVLVDSEPIINRVFVEMLGELGFSLDYAEVLREFSGASMNHRLETMESRLGWRRPADFVAGYQARIQAAVERELAPVPGVREVLERLEGPVCVASNGASADLRGRLRVAGLLERFEPHLFSAIEIGRGKPEPDVFLHAARVFGVEPARSAVVEDSLPGVEAGRRAGMSVFGFARLGDARALERAGARPFHDMSELPELLGCA